jgi:hypothetical protein
MGRPLSGRGDSARAVAREKLRPGGGYYQLAWIGGVLLPLLSENNRGRDFEPIIAFQQSKGIIRRRDIGNASPDRPISCARLMQWSLVPAI